MYELSIKTNMNYRLLLTILFSIVYYYGNAQECLCQDEFVQICYYSADDVCPPGNDCRFTLDGQFMFNGLTPKLQNPDLFGSEGVVNCPVQLQKIIDVSSVDYLNEQQCDIIFIGVFSDSHFEPKTDLPIEELEIIKEWSVECEQNLVIVSQFEASVWGYTMSNENINPNVPDVLNSTSSIFDGPFGVVTEFQQSGTYQGVITGTPSTPFDVLGRDGNNQPTIVLDQETNDIVLGDISMLTQFGNLVMSPGSEILVDNDILAGNLFALGCGIANRVFTTVQDIVLCEGDSYQLPGGDVISDAGLYIDSLVTSGDCDSLVFTRVEEAFDSQGFVTYDGCNGDGYAVTIGSITYDEFNDGGMQIIANARGCDSLVMVSLDFQLQDTTYLDYDLCDGESVVVGGETFNEDTDRELVLPTSNGCDSVVFLTVRTSISTRYVTPEELIIDVNEPFTFPFNYPQALEIGYEPASAFSCQNCDQPNLIEGERPDSVVVSVIDKQGCDFGFVIAPTYICEPYLPNIINPNSGTEMNRGFGLVASCNILNFQLKVFSRSGSEVFSTIDINERWDGTFNGAELNPGVFIYTLDYDSAGEPMTKTGTVTVLR